MGNRLQMLRARRSLSQEALGEKVGVSGAQISRLEGGAQGLTEDMVYKLSQALRCHPGELFQPVDQNPLIDEAVGILSAMTDDQIDGFLRMHRQPAVRRGRRRA